MRREGLSIFNFEESRAETLRFQTFIKLTLPSAIFTLRLWHGAEWKFALWGSLHGLFLTLERLMSRRDAEAQRKKSQEIASEKPIKRNPSKTTFSFFQSLRLCASARKLLSWFVTFHLVTLHGVMLFLIFTNPGAPRGFTYFQF